MIYIVIFCMLCVLRLVTLNHARLSRQLYPPIIAALFVFVAFRLEVGCDWDGYYRNFLIQLDQELPDALAQREPLWWGLVQILGQLGLSYPWLNVASAAIFFTGVHILAQRQPDPLGFLILLFPILIINMPMSGIRQAAAIGLICIAFSAFSRVKPVSFVVYTLLASGFHSSACIFLLFTPFVGQGNFKIRLLLSFVLSGPGLYVLSNADTTQLAIARYVGTGVDAQGAIYRAGLLCVSALGYFAFLRPSFKKQYPSECQLVTFGAIAMLGLLPLVSFSSVIADRLGYYLIPLQTVFLARIPQLDLGLNKILYIIAPYLMFAIVLLVWTIKSGHFAFCYLPYDNWIFALPDTYRSSH